MMYRTYYMVISGLIALVLSKQCCAFPIGTKEDNIIQKTTVGAVKVVDKAQLEDSLSKLAKREQNAETTLKLNVIEDAVGMSDKKDAESSKRDQVIKPEQAEKEKVDAPVVGEAKKEDAEGSKQDQVIKPEQAEKEKVDAPVVGEAKKEDAEGSKQDQVIKPEQVEKENVDAPVAGEASKKDIDNVEVPVVDESDKIDAGTFNQKHGADQGVNGKFGEVAHWYINRKPGFNFSSIQLEIVVIIICVALLIGSIIWRKACYLLCTLVSTTRQQSPGNRWKKDVAYQPLVKSQF